MSEPTTHIVIPGDVLIPDKEFCETVLNGATTRTGQRADRRGCPFVYVNGKKMRPLNEGRAWLAKRIQRRGQAPVRHKGRA